MKNQILNFIFICIVIFSSGLSAQEIELQKVKIASAAHIVNFLPLDLAVAKGYFEDEGLKAEIVYLRGGTLCAQALIAGQVDFSINSIAHALKAAAKGNDNLRMVCLLNETPGALIVVDSKYKDKVNTIAALEGMRIGVTSHGSITHMIIAFLLAKNNVSLESVEIIKTGTSTFPAALQNGNVDAGITGEPFASMLVENGDAFVLKRLVSKEETEQTFGGPYNLLGLVTRQDYINSNARLVQKVVNIHIRSLKWISEHSAEEIVQVLPSEYVGSDPKVYIKTLKLMKHFLSVDGSLSIAGAENVLSSMKLSGIFSPSENFKVENFLNEDFLDKERNNPNKLQIDPSQKENNIFKNKVNWLFISIPFILLLFILIVFIRRK